MGGQGSGTPKAALIKLDGTQIDSVGNETQTDFFNFLNLPEDHKADLNKLLTPEQALKFRNHIIRMKVGTSAAIPRLCGGPRCKIAHCPFHETQNWPLGEPCVIEASLIVGWMKSYVEDLGVELDNRIDMILVNKLVECDIIDYRANIGFAVDEDAWNLLKVDVTDDGQRTTEITNAHPLIEIKERIHRIRQQVLESLAATRKEKYKRAAALKQRDDETIGDHFANLKKALGAATRTAKTPSIDDIKADAEELANEDIEETDWENSTDTF